MLAEHLTETEREKGKEKREKEKERGREQVPAYLHVARALAHKNTKYTQNTHTYTYTYIFVPLHSSTGEIVTSVDVLYFTTNALVVTIKQGLYHVGVKRSQFALRYFA